MKKKEKEKKDHKDTDLKKDIWIGNMRKKQKKKTKR